jgi:hypothetical protein
MLGCFVEIIWMKSVVAFSEAVLGIRLEGLKRAVKVSTNV